MGTKPKRKARESTLPKTKDLLTPIDITKLGSIEDPCFGKHYNLSTDECKRCGDSELCAIVLSQQMNKDRKNIEGKNRFKDLEVSKDNKAIDSWVKNKVSEGLDRGEIIRLAKKTFGSSRDEIKIIYAKYKKKK